MNAPTGPQQKLLRRQQAERAERNRAPGRYRGRFGHADVFYLSQRLANRLLALMNDGRSFVEHGDPSAQEQ